VQALQSMHKLGLVHADVKAENFAISHTAAAAAAASGSLSSAAGAETHSTDQRKVYLLDMGFAHPWQGGQHC
jgi:serine/threonine protein kinase